MVEGRIYFERAAARRGRDQGTRAFVGRLSGERDYRYRALSHE
jgi:hypothetical protein